MVQASKSQETEELKAEILKADRLVFSLSGFSFRDFDHYVLRLALAQRQVVSPHSDLKRVAEGRGPYECDGYAGKHAHLAQAERGRSLRWHSLNHRL